MRTLELKHLEPYLPYGLKLIFPKSGRIICLSRLQHTDSGTFIFIATDGNFYEATIWGFKPIIRPLSDLTKEIEHNAEKFVPIEKLDDMYGQTLTRDEYNHLISPISIEPYILIRQLFEWHFDVFALIPQGLAIDINSIEN